MTTVFDSLFSESKGGMLKLKTLITHSVDIHRVPTVFMKQNFFSRTTSIHFQGLNVDISSCHYPLRDTSLNVKLYAIKLKSHKSKKNSQLTDDILETV